MPTSSNLYVETIALLIKFQWTRRNWSVKNRANTFESKSLLNGGDNIIEQNLDNIVNDQNK